MCSDRARGSGCVCGTNVQKKALHFGGRAPSPATVIRRQVNLACYMTEGWLHRTGFVPVTNVHVGSSIVQAPEQRPDCLPQYPLSTPSKQTNVSIVVNMLILNRQPQSSMLTPAQCCSCADFAHQNRPRASIIITCRICTTPAEKAAEKTKQN